MLEHRTVEAGRGKVTQFASLCVCVCVCTCGWEGQALGKRVWMAHVCECVPSVSVFGMLHAVWHQHVVLWVNCVHWLSFAGESAHFSLVPLLQHVFVFRDGAGMVGTCV